jgi:hypothetical protein
MGRYGPAWTQGTRSYNTYTYSSHKRVALFLSSECVIDTKWPACCKQPYDGARFSHPALQGRNCESQEAGETRVQNSSKSRVSKNAIALMTLPSFIWKYHV